MRPLCLPCLILRTGLLAAEAAGVDAAAVEALHGLQGAYTLHIQSSFRSWKVSVEMSVDSE